MGPNNLCYVTRHFLFFLYVAMSLFIRLHLTFYSFWKSPCRTSTTFKVAVSHFVFYRPCTALEMDYCQLTSMASPQVVSVQPNCWRFLSSGQKHRWWRQPSDFVPIWTSPRPLTRSHMGDSAGNEGLYMHMWQDPCMDVIVPNREHTTRLSEWNDIHMDRCSKRYTSG